MLDEARPIVLTPTSYLVLGLIAGRDRVTSYELKQFVAVSIGYFWPFPHSQLYAEPARLVAAGLLAEDIETAGRKRRYYAITDAGRTALTSWLEQPTENRTEIRDLGLLKLFFASHAGASDRLRLAQDQLSAHEEMLKEYEELHARVSALADPWELHTIEMGMRFERLSVQFWSELHGELHRDIHREIHGGIR
jgi:PadR family transcriptional regulator AphA